MPNWLAKIVWQKVLLGHISHVFGIRVLGKQMVERLVLVRPDILRDREPPFFRVVEDRSISKITPRNEKIRWRTIWPIWNLAIRAFIILGRID